MGCDQKRDTGCRPNEMPGHLVELPDYEIDQTEVTRAAYQACVQAGVCAEAPESCLLEDIPGRDHAKALKDCLKDSQFLPVDCVHWDQAAAYCAWVGKRLPSEAEWEKAARGEDRRPYPWGDNAPDCSRAIMADPALAEGCGCSGPAPVCSRLAGNSSLGVCDMAGNVMEWVADWYDEKAYAADAPPSSGFYKVVRGGEWSDRWLPAKSSGSGDSGRASGRSLRVTTRVWQPPLHGRGFGFRCAR
jgi:formylglycine-generating enzyme required for sulfatase activity